MQFNSSYRYMYSYNQAGRVTAQRMYRSNTTADGSALDLVANYTWDNEGRMTSLAYCGFRGMAISVPN